MNQSISFVYALILLIGLNINKASGQDPLRFKEQVEALSQIEYAYDTAEKVVLFTGSSSIRMWNDLQDYFPDHQIVRNGFGGSQMSDLLFYADELILKYAPDQVFIYEGDNDIATGKTPSEIMTTTVQLIEKIEQNLKNVQIVLIAAKPSVSRWSLKHNYEELNRRFEIYSSKKNNVLYADVWTIMLSEDGIPKKHVFLTDSLHMNKQGYDLWAEVIGEFLE